MRGMARSALLQLTRRTRLRGRLRIAQLLNRLLAPPGGYVLSTLPSGLCMELDLTDPLQHEFYYIGRYEEDELAFLRAALPTGGVFLDVGANVGWHTLSAAQRVGPTGHVYAFEPMPLNLERLRRNLELNQIRNVTLAPFALSDRHEEVELSTCFERSGNASLVPTPGARRTVRVDSVPFDDYMRREKIGRIDLVKIDVEGAELKVLKGMTGLLADTKAPPIILEMNPDLLELMGTSAREVAEFLASFGYTARAPGSGRLMSIEGMNPSGDWHENVIFARSQLPARMSRG